jgi:hypothetical protein
LNADPFDTSKLYEKCKRKSELEPIEDNESHLDSESEVKSNARFRLESDAESELKPPSQPKKYTGDDAWLNDRFSRLLLTTFHDGKRETFQRRGAHRGQRDRYEYVRPSNAGKSMLFNLYLNLACAYMSMNHFSEARIVLEAAKELAGTNSLYLFRSAQVRTYCLDSQTQDLNAALEEVRLAKENKRTEKIFQHEKPLLKMLNLHNFTEALDELEFRIIQRKKELKEMNDEKVSAVLARVNEINQIEQMIINEGKIPEEGPDFNALFNEDENMEDLILKG